MKDWKQKDLDDSMKNLKLGDIPESSDTKTNSPTKYWVMTESPGTMNKSFWMADCGTLLSNHTRYYIASDKNELDAPQFAKKVCKLLNDEGSFVNMIKDREDACEDAYRQIASLQANIEIYEKAVQLFSAGIICLGKLDVVDGKDTQETVNIANEKIGQAINLINSIS